jgi:outer membrane cobalamin receptor
MPKSNFAVSLLATTVIAGFAVAAPAHAQDTAPPPAGATDTTAPGGATTPGDTQAGTTPNSGPGAQPQEAVPPAQGQGGEIIVTGTLIRNPNLTSSSPVAVVGQQEIQLRAPNSAEDILRTVPGVVPGLGQNVNNGATGQATVDLRGLGAKRNLVMLDSTRIVPATSTGLTDLNNIPLALIDRVDVLTGGGGAPEGGPAGGGVGK